MSPNTAPSSPPPADERSFWRWHGPRLLALAFSVSVMAAIVWQREQLVALRHYGYLGVFLISMLGNATVVLPAPSLAIVFAGGGVLNPLLVGLVAGVAEPLGEMTGYLAGYGGSAVIEDRERFERIKSWMLRRGFWTIVVLAAVPNPFFDIAGIAAGMLRYPVVKFLTAAWLGKTFKALVIAHIGSLSFGLIEPWLGG